MGSVLNCSIPLNGMKAFNSVFRFKKFHIQHSEGVFKLGTDAVLLGSWAILQSNGDAILDVGTGTGIVGFMAAQRTERQIIGIDVAPDAIRCANLNRESNPYRQRISFRCSSIESFEPDIKLEDVLMNPPYFINHTPNAKPTLIVARHGDADLPQRWLNSPAALSNPELKIHLILPTASVPIWERTWKQAGWTQVRCQRIQGRRNGPIIRQLICLGKNGVHELEPEPVHVYESDGSRSAWYQTLTESFYLDENKKEF